MTSALLRDLRSIKDLTAALRFSSEAACRAWLHRQQIPFVKRGRVILVDARDVAAQLRKRASA